MTDMEKRNLQETIDCDDLVRREGLFYKKFTNVPFTGEATGQKQGKLKDGTREGEWRSYYDTGGLAWTGTFKNAERISD